MSVLSALVAPGFLSNGPVHVALWLGGAVAVVSAPVGVVTVLRRQSFAGHALGDLGPAGGAAAFLLGMSPLWGFLGVSLLGAGAIEAAGARRDRGRDVATGVVFGAALGLSALLLYLDSTTTSTTGATMTVLFGSLFVVSPSTVPAVLVLGAVALTLLAVCYRPLLLSALSPEVAAARGAPVRLAGLGYLLALGVAVALSAMTVGAVLSTALLVGPSGAALQLTRRPGTAIAAAAAIGVGATFLGTLLSYDSYTWPPTHHGWTVSFFVVALLFVAYLLAHFLARRAGARRRRRLGGERA